MSHLPGNPFAEGPDNFRETLHLAGKSHLAYEISATLALAYEQRTVAMVHWATHLARTSRPDEELETEITERLGLRAEK